MTQAPEISVIIPVYNEEESLPPLFERLFSVMEGMNRPYELIFINDGSRDKSLSILYALFQKHGRILRIIDFNGNFGQHMAIMAGFEKARGEYIITIDADLQNPPEEIPRLVEALDAGHDVVGTVRVARRRSESVRSQ